MDRLPDIAMWVTFVVGVLFVVDGVLTLAQRRVLGRQTARARALQWQPWGLMQVWLGIAFLVPAVPRLVGLTSGWVFVFSILAFFPLAVGVKFALHAKTSPATATPLTNGSDTAA